MIEQFENEYSKGAFVISCDRRNVKIQCQMKEHPFNNEIFFISGNPVEHRASFSGSGLPFASYDQAFDSRSFEVIKVDENGIFMLDTFIPNSYMVALGSVKVPPSIMFVYKSMNGEEKSFVVKVCNGIPFRTLTYPRGGNGSASRKDAYFYDNIRNLPVRSQETILIESAYPEDLSMPKNFWNLKPST